MWNDTSLDMMMDSQVAEKLKKYSKTIGIIFIILGLIGIVYPFIMSLTTLYFVAYIALFAGISLAIFTYSTNKKEWAGWFKSFVLILFALLMIFYPIVGVETLIILFAVYFFMDAFSSFGLAFSQKTHKLWFVWLLNAIFSLALGIIFIVASPSTSIVLVGVYVGISLLFDGMALLMGSSYIGKFITNTKS